MESDEISVVVRDAVATRIGVVDSLRERRAATENAREGGAKEVRNYLRVR